MQLLSKEIEKRVVIKLNKSIRSEENLGGIMTFGEQNDYPQIIEKLILGSQTAKACAKVNASFIGGSGFVNESIGSVVVGKDKKGKNITLDKVRRDLAISLSMYNGARLHANFNREMKVVNVKVMPFKNCRFSKEDSQGFCAKVGEHVNWEQDSDGVRFNKDEINWYYNWNINKEVWLSNVANSGASEDGQFHKFKGQVYSLDFDDSFLYPLSMFDSVYLDMDTEYQIQLFKNRQIRNGFADKVIIIVDAPSDEKDAKELHARIVGMMGADGENVVVLESDFNEETGELENSAFKVERIQTTINDKLFENWESSLANNIRKACDGMPAVLIDYEQGQLSQASGEMLTQAINYYNQVTASKREALSELFADVFSHFDNPILANNKDWTIKPMTFQ